MPIPRLKRLLGNLAALLHPSMPIRSGLHGSMLTRDPAMVAQSQDDPYIRGIATPGWFFSTQKTQLTARAMASQFKLPLLLLVPGQDSVANPQAAIEFFDRCGSADKTILKYPEHRHELLRELGREQIFKSIFDWIQARL
jgi:alpha-beta hydrolase superfamily lysophospholipase